VLQRQQHEERRFPETRVCVGGEGGVGEFFQRSKMSGEWGPSLMNLYAETAMIWHKNKSNSNGNAERGYIKQKFLNTRVQRTTTLCEISADSRKTHLLCFVASPHFTIASSWFVLCDF